MLPRVGRQSAHRKRCRRWDIPWDAHFLTFSCFRRRAFLSKDGPRQWFLEALERARVVRPFDLWGFVIMPEHVHLLILPHEGQRISAILNALKQPVTQRAVAYLRRTDPQGLSHMLELRPAGRRALRFWQPGGGYGRNMRSVREVHEKLRYIHDNPVTRGLVEHPEEWLWSSAWAWGWGIDEPIRIDRQSFPVLELTRPGG